MKYPCIDCGREIRRVTGRKFLQGCYSDHNAIAVIEMLKKICDGSKGCGKAFVLQISYPLNAQLGIVITSHEDWALFNSGLKNKPGTPIGGTTVSEYTQRIARGVQLGKVV